MKQPLTGRFSSQAEKTPLREVDLRASTMQPNYKVHIDYKFNTANELKDKATLADDFVELEEDTSLLLVVRHILAAPNQEEDWKCNSIFQTIVRCGTKARMLIIDGDSDMNVVSKATVERLKLSTEPHPKGPKPYKVMWINLRRSHNLTGTPCASTPSSTPSDSFPSISLVSLKLPTYNSGKII